MQLSRLVQFHKVLADPTRIKMILLLSNKPLNGQELAEMLNISTPTVTHHVNKLREVGLLHQRRDKNTIYFTLDEKTLERSNESIIKLIRQAKSEEGKDMLSEEQTQMRDHVIQNFFTSDGRLKQIPSQLKKKVIILEYLIGKLEKEKQYQEREINQFIKQFHDDFATIRREFIMHQFMYRENSVYELNPRELWTKWEKLS
ncbi:putative transcriptional regulator [Bacillus mesophilus]|uniref:Metalloregulator ArsR/SmtB family transcription factor n=1 Tax=Bacillus mesophilus TaxID=1808955 RepID=A0A6M0QCP6_9BACI|nr:metalloregulator ArsR/SmtB family transcription factor [Bacillus mesophilus]MBM7662632.1 putative transcriptional regulator [Bacillus mesophilus]NEY73300.1 metalloregulator ArsR/SmtB family transcription factor [Bacillus mesophilus]